MHMQGHARPCNFSLSYEYLLILQTYCDHSKVVQVSHSGEVNGSASLHIPSNRDFVKSSFCGFYLGLSYTSVLEINKVKINQFDKFLMDISIFYFVKFPNINYSFQQIHILLFFVFFQKKRRQYFIQSTFALRSHLVSYHQGKKEVCG